MPTSPPRSCRHPHCPHSARQDGFCEQHHVAAFAGHHAPMPPGWQKTKAAVLRRDRHKCRDCGGRATTVDHVWPRAWGGSDHPSNLEAVCEPCHDKRTARTLAWTRRT